MIPITSERVPEHTADRVNMRIREETHGNVERIAAEGVPAINRRLRELDAEWDIERTLEANAATIAVIGSGLALFVDRRFAVMPLSSARSFFSMPSRAGAFRCRFSAEWE